MALMAWGENIQIFMELGFPTQVFTLDSATDGVLDSDFLDGTLVGEDVSAYAQDVSISRGRSDQLQNFNAGTFYTSVVTGSTFFNVTNLGIGETANVLITVAQNSPSPSPTASFSSNVRQISGSNYIPSSGSGVIDMLSFVSFDGTTAYLVSAKRFV